MEILAQLGIDSTAFVQFGIYVVSFFTFYYLIFKPYFEAFNKRVEHTFGSQENSEKIVEQTNELKVEFDRKTQSINESYKEIFDNQRTLAMNEHDRIIGEARDKAKSIIENTREKIKSEIDKTKTELQTHIPEVSNQVVEKLL